MASCPGHSDSGLLRGARTRSYGSLVQSPYSPARLRKVEHQVQPGDTLQGLSLKYGVTMEQIKRVNRLYTNDSIFLKKCLSIPVMTEQPDLSNGLNSQDGSGDQEQKSEELATKERGKSQRHAGQKEEMSASDFMNKLDTRIRVSKRAAVKKLREGETIVTEEDSGPGRNVGYQAAHAEFSGEQSPRTQQRSLLGPVPLTITTRASTVKDREDEIFKL
ncbi:lysM and putative peptidoglycan-binding domain-containing protein 1 [Rhinophrynus dorsalis]